LSDEPKPKSIAELDAELLPLIEAARAAGDQRFVDRALEVRTIAFANGESGRWFLQGFIHGRKTKP
jgi:hypothetical protein